MQKSFSDFVNQQNEEIKNPKLEQAKQKVQSEDMSGFEQLINNYRSTLNGFDGTSGELAFYYHSIVNIINSNVGAATTWNNTVAGLSNVQQQTNGIKSKSNFKLVIIISLIAALFFGGIGYLATGEIIGALIFGAVIFVIGFAYLIIDIP